jgi:hypothetical protein
MEGLLCIHGVEAEVRKEGVLFSGGRLDGGDRGTGRRYARSRGVDKNASKFEPLARDLSTSHTLNSRVQLITQREEADGSNDKLL